ncbi:hypothetical protein BCR43DRAFT_485452 [Syncephalastrum racemosum]|uniref:Uncharacterized protein n=1 Tax=Syncephalastrum racemosum TaxID=13706 RepID=A0A1X2HMF1_SYNRA|nr:hypothetical protein BCR43DRAFT_485452 [Syncephalastrum racemosum]
MTINVNVKSSSDKKFVITIETSKTVLDLKNAIAEQTDVPADRQRLIYSGRVLKDPDTLEACKIADGNTVHMVKGSQPGAARGNSSSSAPATNPSQPQQQEQQNQQQQQPQPQNPFAALGGMGVGMGMGGANANAGSGGAGTGIGTGGGDMGANPFGMFGSGFGAGAAGNSFGAPDPGLMNQMLQNPMFAQYMSTVLQNPAVLDSIISSNPQLSSMGPEIRTMMQSPEFRQMLTNPDMIRQMATMASAMQGMVPPQQQQQQTNNTNATPQQQQQQQQPPFNPFAAFGNAPAVDPQLQQRMASLFGAGLPGAGGAAAAQPVDNRPPEERYQVQLQQLNEMGFWDAAKNIRILQACGGDVNAAIEMLFNGN